jgi:hypothetical protein
LRVCIHRGESAYVLTSVPCFAKKHFNYLTSGIKFILNLLS